jgi:HEAT repeat protein
MLDSAEIIFNGVYMRTFLLCSLFLPVLGFGQTSEAKLPAAADYRERATGLLGNSLKDKNPDTRKHAVQALSLVSASGPWLSQIEAMLDDKDVEVRLAAITSLVDLKGAGTIPMLQKALDSDVPEVSFAAAKALWTLNDPAGRDALLAVLDGETKASSGFITRKKREALRMLQTPKTLFMFALVAGAGFAPVPGLGAGLSSLQGILADPTVSGRAAAALLLSTEKTPQVLEALRDALTDSNWSVRAAAVHVIAVRNDPALEADLIPMLDDKKDAVRVRAAAGYLRLEALSSAGDRRAKLPGAASLSGKN